MTTPSLAIDSPDGRGRLYRYPLDGRLVPSVTTVIGERDKPGLREWACRQVATAAVDHRHDLDQLVQRVGGRCVAERLAGVPNRVASEAGAVGDAVHGWLEAVAKGLDPPEVPDAARPWIRGAEGFLRTYQPEWLLVEASVFNLTVGYAGTCDFVARIGDEVLIGDYKTGRVHPGAVAMQLAALANAEEVVEPDGTRYPLPDLDGGVVVAITRNGEFAARRVAIEEEAWRAFQALLFVRTTLGDDQRFLGDHLPVARGVRSGDVVSG